MTRTPIAVIKLMPGQAGYYDEYSRVYLTIGNPTATIYSGTNCAQLRRSIKNGTIGLVSGSLGPNVPPVKIVEDGKGGARLVSNYEEEHKPVFTKEDVIEEKPVVEETKPVEATEETETVEETDEAAKEDKKPARRRKPAK